MATRVHDLQVGAVGAVLTVTITDGGAAVDLTDATSIDIILRAPNGTRVTLAASVSGDPEDGVVTATTASGDIAVPGQWLGQAYVVFDDGNKFYSSAFEIDVGKNV